MGGVNFHNVVVGRGILQVQSDKHMVWRLNRLEVAPQSNNSIKVKLHRMKIKSNSIPIVVKLLGLSLVLWDSKSGHLLYSHLRHYIKGGETSTGKALLVLAHLDGIQPLIHSVEAGVIRDCAVKEGEVHPETQKWAMTDQKLQA